MNSFRKELWFEVPSRFGLVNITPQVETCLQESGIAETLRITPAMAAGITDHVWSLEDIAMLVNAAFLPKKRGTYKKQISN